MGFFVPILKLLKVIITTNEIGFQKKNTFQFRPKISAF